MSELARRAPETWTVQLLAFSVSPVSCVILDTFMIGNTLGAPTASSTSSGQAHDARIFKKDAVKVDEKKAGDGSKHRDHCSHLCNALRFPGSRNFGRNVRILGGYSLTDSSKAGFQYHFLAVLIL